MTRQAQPGIHARCNASGTASWLRAALVVLMTVVALPACSTSGTLQAPVGRASAERQVVDTTLASRPDVQTVTPVTGDADARLTPRLEPRLVGLWACRSSATRRQDDRDIVWSSRWTEHFGTDGTRYSRMYVGLSISGLQGVYAIAGRGYWHVRGRQLLTALPEADVAAVSDTLLTRNLSYPDNARASLAEEQVEVWSLLGEELRRYDFRNGLYSVCERTDSEVVEIPRLPPVEPVI